MLKCQFHTHAKGDPVDHISHTPKALINEAARLNYDVLIISCHEKVIFNKNLKKYADKKGILLIPGIEASISKKHVLIINATKKAEKIKTFDDLKIYREKNPNCLVIAAHPFFPGSYTLKKTLIEKINLFDAIEHSFCYTKTKNYNKKAIELAKRWKKPLIATSDCHILKYLDISYSLIDSKKNLKEIIQAIKANKIKLITKPISHFITGKILLLMIFKKFSATIKIQWKK